MKLPLEEEGHDCNPDPPSPHNAANNQSDNDFSEYLWMEHEEEFDQQVLQELEEQDLIDYYFDLYQESLRVQGSSSDGARSEFPPQIRHPPRQATVGTNTILSSSSLTSTHDSNMNGHGSITTATAEDLSGTFTSVLAFHSRLNPNAAEFVPRQVASDAAKEGGTDSRTPSDNDGNDGTTEEDPYYPGGKTNL